MRLIIKIQEDLGGKEGHGFGVNHPIGDGDDFEDEVAQACKEALVMLFKNLKQPDVRDHLGR